MNLRAPTSGPSDHLEPHVSSMKPPHSLHKVSKLVLLSMRFVKPQQSENQPPKIDRNDRLSSVLSDEQVLFFFAFSFIDILFVCLFSQNVNADAFSNTVKHSSKISPCIRSTALTYKD